MNTATKRRPKAGAADPQPSALNPPPSPARQAGPTDDTLTDCQELAFELRELEFAVDQESVAKWPPEWRSAARQYVEDIEEYQHACESRGETFHFRGGLCPDPPVWLQQYSPGEINGEKPPARPPVSSVSGHPDIVRVHVDQIAPSPHNHRTAFDPAELKKLGESMKANGQLQNCVLRPHPDYAAGRPAAQVAPAIRYELVAGERRWRAAKLVKMETLLCRVIDVTDEEAIELRGLENFEREQLNPIEEATWFEQMTRLAGYTQTALAKKLGVSQEHISNRMRLLKLPEAWRACVVNGELPPTHARSLLGWCDGDEFVRDKVFGAVEKRLTKQAGDGRRETGDAGLQSPASLSAREFERLVKEAARDNSKPMARGDYYGRKFSDSVKKKHEAALHIAPVPGWDGRPEQRAFNVALFQKLEKEAKANAEKRKPKESRDESPGTRAGKKKAEPAAREPNAWQVTCPDSSSENRPREL